MPAAAVPRVTPKAGECHLSVDPVSYASTYAPVDCARTHRAETISVQEFTGAPAAPVSLPAAGSPALRRAFDICDDDARGFVGADWRGGPDSVHERCVEIMEARATRRDRSLVRTSGTAFRMPSKEAWQRGDRGVRCFVWLDDRPMSRSVLTRPAGIVDA
jgi:hypothetical protein